jgi:signal transduction histidine kinase
LSVRLGKSIRMSPSEAERSHASAASRLFQRRAPAVDWPIVLYAALALAAGWAYASLRIQSDHHLTLDLERNQLRSVTAALQAGTQAMLNDGIGAAIAGANAVMTSHGDMDSASAEDRAEALSKMLTGGAYVRSLFLYSPARFARAGRDGVRETADAPPGWLQLPRSSLNGSTWVGKPIPDPDMSGQMVFPVARHIITPERDGVWAGVLFEFAELEDLFRRLGGDVKVIGLISGDGTVLSVLPRDVSPGLTPGRSVSENELFRRAMKHPESGVVEGFGEVMGTNMLYGYENVHGYDMSILSGQTRDAALEPWRDHRRTTLMVTSAASLLLIVMTAMLSHYSATRRRIGVEREQALADLSRTAGELMRLQDDERRRIGRDLHDSTGQTLAALELSLSRVIQASARSADRRELLEQCAQLASQCSNEIRTASYLLHPPLLDELGLLSALRWLADGFHARSGIEVRLDLPDAMFRLSRDEELTFFRVAQEALTNVHRHAASPWAALRLRGDDRSVVLEIEDGGQGERAPGASRGSFPLGVGLAGMRERVRQVGGTFTVEARPSGTLVRATLPRTQAQQ